MTDKKLKKNLQKNASAILEIMERNGIDVSRYKKLAEELKEKEARQKAKKKVYRQNHKESAFIFLKNFAYSEIVAEERQREKNNLLALKDCILLADKQTAELQQLLKVETAIKNGKKPYYKTAKPLQLKSIENMPGRLERAQKKQEERHKQVKQDFIKYYCESWFYILLDLIKNKTILRSKSK